MNTLDKGQYFRLNYRSKINYVIDKFIDEETNKEVYELARPIGSEDFLEADDTRLSSKNFKASYNVYDILYRDDLVKVDIGEEIDVIGQLYIEDGELVTYLKGKRYTLEELKQKDAVMSVYDYFSLYDIAINKEELEK